MGARFSAPVQTGPEVHPASCTMGTGSFSGIKRPGRGADHLPPSKRRGHERVELYLFSSSGPSWPVIGRTFTFTFALYYYYHHHNTDVAYKLILPNTWCGGNGLSSCLSKDPTALRRGMGGGQWVVRVPKYTGYYNLSWAVPDWILFS